VLKSSHSIFDERGNMKIVNVADKVPEDNVVNKYVNQILTSMQEKVDDNPEQEYELGGEYAMILSLPPMDGEMLFNVQAKLNEIHMGLQNIELRKNKLFFKVHGVDL